MKRPLETGSLALAAGRGGSDHYVKIRKEWRAERRCYWILEMNGPDSG